MGPAYWIAGFNEKNNNYVFKVAVYNATATQSFNVVFPGVPAGAEAKLTVLTSKAGASAVNEPGKPEVVDEAVTTVSAAAGGFKFALPSLSVAVLSWKRA